MTTPPTESQRAKAEATIAKIYFDKDIVWNRNFGVSTTIAIDAMLEFSSQQAGEIDRQQIDIETIVRSQEKRIIELLSRCDYGYGLRKKFIAEKTGLADDILTVILKRMKLAGTIEIMIIWSEQSVRPDGPGYCLSNHK